MTTQVTLTREELVMIHQALDLRGATMRVNLDSHGKDYKFAGFVLRKNSNLADKIHKEMQVFNRPPPEIETLSSLFEKKEDDSNHGNGD